MGLEGIGAQGSGARVLGIRGILFTGSGSMLAIDEARGFSPKDSAQGPFGGQGDGGRGLNARNKD